MYKTFSPAEPEAAGLDADRRNTIRLNIEKKTVRGIING
jgi:hypothetical protein